METLNVSHSIIEKIDELEKSKKELPFLANMQAITESQYEKEIALTIMGLRNGKEYVIDDTPITDPSVSLIDKLAKGICYKKKLEMNLAESSYKNTLKNIEITQAQLNGFQSINRHLSEA